MRQALLAVSLLSLSVLAACGETTPPAATPSEATASAGSGELVMYANGSATSLKMEGDRAWGPSAELTRFDGAYRGTFNGRSVDLHMEGDRVFGTIGTSKVDIHVSGDGVQVHGQGLLNGHISTFDVNDATLEGSFGLCSYQMKRKEQDATGKYVGYQSCSGSIYPASHVTIPEFYRSLSALDQATLYTILLVG